MVKIPKKVRIGPHSYEISHDAVAGLILQYGDNHGECDPDHLKIRLDENLPHTQLAETLLHEILHCCWSQTALKIDESTSELEEQVVASLSPLLLGVLRSNPKLIKYLLSDATDK